MVQVFDLSGHFCCNRGFRRIQPLAGTTAKTRQRPGGDCVAVQAVAADLLARHHMVWLGGDHSVTLPILRALRPRTSIRRIVTVCPDGDSMRSSPGRSDLPSSVPVTTVP